MKAFISVKYHADMCNRAHIEDIAGALEGNGCETMCIVRDVERWGELRFDARGLMQQTFASIRWCDVLVVDASEKGVGKENHIIFNSFWKKESRRASVTSTSLTRYGSPNLFRIARD